MRKKKKADSRLSRSNMMSNTLLTYARGYEAKNRIQSPALFRWSRREGALRHSTRSAVGNCNLFCRIGEEDWFAL